MLDIVVEALSPERQAKIFAALADPVRLRIVRELIAGNERSGTSISDALGISLALLCHHARILAEAGAITKRKEGQTALYRIDRSILSGCMKALLTS
ncbi:MAG: winged helix-turn-helix transcriptional regulator [Bryobacteraceae bacterium]|nr:winged helix-turn-helix transcriptional regulator [Bryobacteraceae bacterium]